MAGYTQYTISSLVAEISTLIDDPTNIQWTYAEVRLAIIEALRYWGALTSYWRKRGGFSTVAGQAWYDLALVLTDGYGTLLRQRVVTINDLVIEMQYHCCENGTGIAGTGQSGQFSVQEMTQAIVRARNRLVADAGLPLSVIGPLAADANRFELPQDVAWIRHGYWIDSGGAYWPLRKIDNWAEQGYDPRWTISPGRPFAYAISNTQPLQTNLYPSPAASGMVEWVVAESAELDPTSATQTLELPDEFAPAVKYAALADLYSMDGETSDPLRSAYAEQRYMQYLPVAEMHRSVLQVEVDGVPLPSCIISSLDSKQPNWRMQQGRPQIAGCDIDLVGFYKVPDAGGAGQGYGVTMDVVVPAPIPASDGEYLQIGRELIGLVTDYVQHYLSFKLAGDEFAMTLDSYDGFMRAAAKRNQQMQKSIINMKAIFNQEGKEQNAQM